jgi:hypothetical protein
VLYIGDFPILEIATKLNKLQLIFLVASMSSISKAPSNNMLSFESSEESSWTKYFEDFFNNDHNNNIDDYNDQKCSLNSFSAFDDGSYSLVSDAAEKKIVDQSAQGGMEYIKRLSFKKRKKIITSLVDDDLEDTASSPINSPKVFFFLSIFLFSLPNFE